MCIANSMHNTYHIGKDETLNLSNGVTHDTVMKLIEHFHGKGHHLYVKDFYTSPTLFTSLKKVNIVACGTLRCNCKGVPNEMRSRSLLPSCQRVTLE